MTPRTGIDVDSDVFSDAMELRRSLLRMDAWALVVTGAIAAWIYLIDTNFRLNIFGVFFSLILEGIALSILAERRLQAAQWLLLLGPLATFCSGLWLMPDTPIAYYAVLLVMANGMLGAANGLAAAGLAALALWLLAPSLADARGPLIVLAIGTALQSIGSHSLRTVLDWALSSQRQASQLLHELRGHQGELNRTVHALTEATRRLQRTGHQLAEARLRADEARQLKERFAANISHELRTPLNLILGFSETMYYTPDVYGDMEWSPTLRRDVHQIYQSSRQLSELVDDVLDLSRVDAARMPIQREASDLGAIVEEAAESARGLLRDRPIVVRTEVPVHLPELHIDRTRIRQVLLNLLRNAVRFTEQGQIVVAVTRGENEVTVAVSDTGVGIPEGELDKIFDEFHQVDMSLRRSREGAGLGLAISKRFVELHGGRIWVESVEGEGSCFSFALPLSTEGAAARLVETEPVHLRRSPEVRPCVVVVDSDVGVRRVLARHLEGYELFMASDLEAAVRLVRRHRPQALLLNVPPGTEGASELVARAVERLPRLVPIITCSIPSASWMTEDMQVAGSLLKPLDRQGLLDGLHAVEHSYGPLCDVLVVDDDRGFVELMRRYLAVEGDGEEDGRYRLRWAYDGAKALELLERRNPDLILLDLIMPGMDGFELLTMLREHPRWRRIPVLIVTASEYGEDVLAARGSAVSLARGKGLPTMTSIAVIEAMLERIEAPYPLDSETEGAKARRDAPVWGENGRLPGKGPDRDRRKPSR